MRLLFALLILAAPAQALACSCAPLFTNSFLAPSMDAIDVPTNAKVWLGAGEVFAQSEPTLDNLDAIEIEDEAGALIPFTGSLLIESWQAVFVLTPEAGFEADSRYTVRFYGEAGSDGVLVARFRTGLDADTEAPAVPTTTSTTVRADSAFPPDGNSCGPADGVSLEIDSSEAFVVADLLGRSAIDTDAIDGEVSAFRTHLEHTLYLGRGGCASSWSDVEIGDTAEWQLGAFDVAGNFSGWSELDSATITAANATATEAGCDASSCSAAGGSGLLLLPALFVGRRRRR